SLVVQWVRLHAPNAGGPGFDPWSGNWISHATTESLHATTKSLHAATKDPACCN
ncbi:hypothetical protein DBR06_SOUSAS8310198, partial [Sousa chinensis]